MGFFVYAKTCGWIWLRKWDPSQSALQEEHVKEGRDFFNEAPKPEYYKSFDYPHPLQNGLKSR